jgi:hypothetical protein
MIYSASWASIFLIQTVTQWNKPNFPGKEIGDTVNETSKTLAEAIKASKDDTFLFLLSNYAGGQAQYNLDQKPQFDRWIKEHELEKYVKFVSAGISNPAHQERKYSLYLAVLQSEEHNTPVELKGMVNA